MRIDSHQHFWEFHPVKDAWIPNEMSVIRKDFLPEDLKPSLEKHNILGCVAVQAAPSEAETNFLLNLAKKNLFIKAVIGWVDFTKPNIRERLEYYSQDKNFKGVRHLLQAKASNYMQQPDFLNGMLVFEEFNLTYDLLVLQHQLLETIELVKRFPNQKFVLNHIAKPAVSKGVSEEWKNQIHELAANKNVYCKLSGFLTETEDFIWEPQDFFPFFEVALDAFGPNRLLFGSDWPVCLSAGKYEDSINILERFFSSQGENVLEKLMGFNATEFYKL